MTGDKNHRLPMPYELIVSANDVESNDLLKLDIIKIIPTIKLNIFVLLIFIRDLLKKKSDCNYVFLVTLISCYSDMKLY